MNTIYILHPRPLDFFSLQYYLYCLRTPQYYITRRRASVYTPVGMQRVVSHAEVCQVYFRSVGIGFRCDFDRVENTGFLGHVQETKVHVEPVGRAYAFVGQQFQDVAHVGPRCQQRSRDELSGCKTQNGRVFTIPFNSWVTMCMAPGHRTEPEKYGCRCINAGRLF